MTLEGRNERTVQRVQRGDMPELSAVIARAFEDDPLYEWFLPNPVTRVARSTALNMAMFPRLLPFDFIEMYTTTDRAGASIWIGPEKWEPPPKAMIGALPASMRALGLRGIARMTGAMGALKKEHPKGPHWYLMGLATDPPKQRTGVGTALVRPMLERCDADHIGAYLETQKRINVPYYERFGFRVTQEIDLPRGGPHLWLMWRDPQ
jgi:GNAT superfamily N-acetyltransferase